MIFYNRKFILKMEERNLKKHSYSLLGKYFVELMVVYVINKMIFNNKLTFVLIFLFILQFIGIVFVSLYAKYKPMQYKKANRYKYYNIIGFMLCLIFIFSFIYYIEYRTVKINDMNDFKKIYSNPDGKYSITKDLNMSNYNLKDDFDFYGTLNGNGYSLIELKTPLFNHVENVKISNLNLTNVDINMSDEIYIGALSKTSKKSHIYKVNVTGNIIGGGFVGGIIGSNPMSIIELSSFIGNVSSKGAFAGGLVGSGGEIKQSYVNAVIEGVVYVGGFSGNSSKIYYSISNSYVKGEDDIAGSVSCASYPECYSENTIILGTIETIDVRESNHFMYLIDTFENQNNIFLGNVIMAKNAKLINKTKVYVLNHSIKLNEYQENLSYVDFDQLELMEFYTNKGFEESIWDFKNLNDGYIPMIKDTNFDHILIK
jgi:hypothetical protein